jgi:hypothetical protein
MNTNGKFILFTVILVVLATICKYFFGPSPEWSGFSPVIAIALFSGFIMRNRSYSFLLPLLALLFSDFIIHDMYRRDLFDYPGFYSGQWKNYLILLSAVLIGWALQAKKISTLAAGAVAAPTLFFLISNFTVWAGQHLTYTKDFNGLMACYAAGLPFYKNSLIATMIFTPGLLYLYNVLVRRKAQWTLA